MAQRVPVFFASGGHRAYGALFVPQASASERRGIVLCPPFADEAVHAHRVLVTLARRLAAEAGLVALLIDYVGTGDSEGAFEDGTLERYVADILAATEHLRAEAGVARCGLLGLRLGGTLATWAAQRDPRLAPLVLWAPLSDLAAYFRRFLRLRLFTELSTAGQRTVTVRTLEQQLGRGEPVDVLGYSISPAMAAGFLGAGPAPPGEGGPILMLTESETAPPRLLGDDPGGRVTVGPAGPEPFWERARVAEQDGPGAMIVDWVHRAMAG